jgi:hypothetical protein
MWFAGEFVSERITRENNFFLDICMAQSDIDNISN